MMLRNIEHFPSPTRTSGSTPNTVLFICPEGIINRFLSLVYKPPTKIASRGAGNWFKADFSPPGSKGKQLRVILHFLTEKWFKNAPTQDLLSTLTSQMVLSRRQGGFYL
jgi:hypothetical protein